MIVERWTVLAYDPEGHHVRTAYCVSEAEAKAQAAYFTDLWGFTCLVSRVEVSLC